MLGRSDLNYKRRFTPRTGSAPVRQIHSTAQATPAVAAYLEDDAPTVADLAFPGALEHETQFIVARRFTDHQKDLAAASASPFLIIGSFEGDPEWGGG